jgi:hypothetical protein
MSSPGHGARLTTAGVERSFARMVRWVLVAAAAAGVAAAVPASASANYHRVGDVIPAALGIEPGALAVGPAPRRRTARRSRRRPRQGRRVNDVRQLRCVVRQFRLLSASVRKPVRNRDRPGERRRLLLRLLQRPRRRVHSHRCPGKAVQHERHAGRHRDHPTVGKRAVAARRRPLGLRQRDRDDRRQRPLVQLGAVGRRAGSVPPSARQHGRRPEPARRLRLGRQRRLRQREGTDREVHTVGKLPRRVVGHQRCGERQPGLRTDGRPGWRRTRVRRPMHREIQPQWPAARALRLRLSIRGRHGHRPAR